MHKPILEVDLFCPKGGKGFENKHRRAGHIGKCKGKETETQQQNTSSDKGMNSQTEKRTETLQEETTSNNNKNKEPEKRTEPQQFETTLKNKQTNGEKNRNPNRKTSIQEKEKPRNR